MAITPQEYPRDEKGFLDIGHVAPHTHKISIAELYAVIAKAITDAAGKSSRAILEGHDHLSEEDKVAFFRGTVRNFVRRLGMMGTKEPPHAETQRASYS